MTELSFTMVPVGAVVNMLTMLGGMVSKWTGLSHKGKNLEIFNSPNIM